MWLHIPEILNAAELEDVRKVVRKGAFADGRNSAGQLAGAVKQNEELQGTKAALADAEQCVARAVQRHPEVQRHALPLRISHPVFARYRPGMHYGWHTDDAVMGQGGYRADVAVTVFLNDPGDYEGGDLVVQSPYGECRARHPAGDAVLYSASRLHCVEEVRSGERQVAVLWIQSQVRDEQQREVLQKLDALRSRQMEIGQEQEVVQLDWLYSRLMRMWVDV